MSPQERIEVLERHINEIGPWELEQEHMATFAWAVAVAKAAVAWRDSHGEGTMTDACIEAALVAVVDDLPNGMQP